MGQSKESRADATRRATERSLQECRDAGVKQYEVSTCGDVRVCAACQKHDGKTYNVEDAVIGGNAPPFCDECRCIIIAVFNFDE